MPALVFYITIRQDAAATGTNTSWLALVIVLAALAVLAFQLIHGRRVRRLLERRVAALSALSEAGRAIVAAQLDVDELCMLIYHQVRQIVDTWTFQLGLFEDNHYRIKVWISRGEQLPETLFDLNEDEGIVGWVRRTGQPLLVRDFRTEANALPARPRYLSDDPPRSAVFVPLIAGDTVIGAMAIQSYRRAAFTADHQRVLSIIANQAAAAIANARLYEAERHRRQIADVLGEVSVLINASLDSEEVLKGVLEGAERLVPFDAAGILFLNNGHSFTLRAARAAPALLETMGKTWPMADGGRLWQLVEARQQRMLEPEEDLGVYHQLLGFPRQHACLFVPISIREQVLGVLVLDRRPPGQYDAQNVALAAALTGQAASALENARLYASGQEEAWISTALLEVAEATGRARSVDEVLETVVRITPMLVGVDRCAILLRSAANESCEVAAAYQTSEGPAELEVGQAFMPGQWSLLDQLWESGSPVVDEFGAIPGAPATEDVETTLLALPLRSQGELTGAMIIGFTGQVALSEHRLKLIAGIANQAALAIESAGLVAAQQEEAWVSLALLQVAEAVANLPELGSVLDVVTRLTPLLVGVENCLIYLWDEEQMAFLPGAAYGVPADRMYRFQTTSLPAAAWPEVLEVGFAPTISFPTGEVAEGWDVLEMIEGPGAGGGGGTRPSVGAMLPVTGPPPPIAESLGLGSPLALPLQQRGELMGVIVVDAAGTQGSLSGRRLHILAGVAQQTATAIQSARLRVESIERQRLERELQLARQIQASFLPAAVPEIPGWDLAAFWQGARQVSGDFYDFIRLADSTLPRGRWGVVVADVADKGVPAALFMALSRTLVRTMAIGGHGPAEVLSRANDMIMSDSRSDLFVTLFYAILDPQGGTLSYANAGHNPPLHLEGSSDTILHLNAEGIALGVVTGVDLEQRSTQIAPGDVLVLYTDGVTDALNAEMHEFGLERLCRVVQAHRGESAAKIVRAVNHSVRDFVGEIPQFDDLTLVVLKRLPEQCS